jgi:hypothetical protein
VPSETNLLFSSLHQGMDSSHSVWRNYEASRSSEPILHHYSWRQHVSVCFKERHMKLDNSALLPNVFSQGISFPQNNYWATAFLDYVMKPMLKISYKYFYPFYTFGLWSRLLESLCCKIKEKYRWQCCLLSRFQKSHEAWNMHCPCFGITLCFAQGNFVKGNSSF